MRYEHFAAKWMLPTRRLQMQIASVAQTIMQANGATVGLSEFLFDPVGTVADEASPEEAAQFFAFNPRRKDVST